MAGPQDQSAAKPAILDSVRGVFGDMPAGRRRLIIGAGVAVFAVLIAVTLLGQGDGDWRPVAHNLIPEDQGSALGALEERKIPHRLSEANTLLVPAARIHEARVALAMTSSSGGRTVGFELFDEAELGRSAFAEQVNYRRALEGELARSIRHIDGVDRARVHLVLPKRSAFRKNDVAPSGSVMVSLPHGRSLDDRQAQAIRQLVAAAVERMDPSAVAIVDQHGSVVARPQDGIGLIGDSHRLKTELEQQLEERVVDLLAPVVGAGSVRAQVALRMDFSRIVETRETYDPESQVVRSEHEKTESKSESKRSAIGAPGAASNLPSRDGDGGGGGPLTKSEKNETVRRYDIDKSSVRKETPTPRIARMSVAVLVGEMPDPSGTGSIPRTPDEIARYRDIVAKAVGLDPARGDEIEVASVPFQPPADFGDELAAPPAAPPATIPMEMIIYGAAGLGLLMLLLTIFFVVRGKKKKKKRQQAADEATEKIDSAEALLDAIKPPPELLGEDRLMERELSKHQIKALRQRAIELGIEDMPRLVMVLERWLRKARTDERAKKQEAA